VAEESAQREQVSVDRYAGEALRVAPESMGWREAPLTRELMNRAMAATRAANPSLVEQGTLDMLHDRETQPGISVDVNAPGLTVPYFSDERGVIAPIERAPMTDPLRGPSYLDKQKFIDITRPDSFAPLS
jgi:hypothetical protein